MDVICRLISIKMNKLKVVKVDAESIEFELSGLA